MASASGSAFLFLVAWPDLTVPSAEPGAVDTDSAACACGADDVTSRGVGTNPGETPTASIAGSTPKLFGHGYCCFLSQAAQPSRVMQAPGSHDISEALSGATYADRNSGSAAAPGYDAKAFVKYSPDNSSRGVLPLMRVTLP